MRRQENQIALIRSLCEELQIPCQVFVSRNDMRCGSTIGPIVASEIGIKTVDIGVAQFAMHSIRELAGVNDGLDFTRLLNAFLESETTDFSEWVEELTVICSLTVYSVDRQYFSIRQIHPSVLVKACRDVLLRFGTHSDS